MTSCKSAETNSWSNKFKIYDTSISKAFIGFKDNVLTIDADRYFTRLLPKLRTMPIYQAHSRSRIETSYRGKAVFRGDVKFYGIDM